MGWTYTNTSNTPALRPNYPISTNGNYPNFSLPTANSFNPSHYSIPAKSYGGMASDLTDPLGNQTQLMQMISMIVQQILQSLMQGGLLGNLAGGLQGGGGGNSSYPISPNSSGYGNLPYSPNGSGYEGGMSRFRPFATGETTQYPNTKNWWSSIPEDCRHGEHFRNCRSNHPPRSERDEPCEGHPSKPPKSHRPPKGETPPEECTPPSEPPATPEKPKKPVPPAPPEKPKPGTPVSGKIYDDPHFLGADGEYYKVPMEPGTYKLIADNKVAVNTTTEAYGNDGRNTSSDPKPPVMKKLGFNFDGDKLKTEIDASGNPVITLNGVKMNTKENFNKNGYSWDAKTKTLGVEKTVDGETWKLSANYQYRGLASYWNLHILEGSKVNVNNTRTSGLWGDSISGTKEQVNDNGGAGVLRGPNGKPLDPKLKPGDPAYEAALQLYKTNVLV